jgi:hypothetical protein
VLTPIPVDPPIKPPIKPPASIYNQHEVSKMSEKIIVNAEGPQGKLARINPKEAGQGPFGWYAIHWDGTDPNDPNCQFEQTKPDTKFTLTHVATGALFGADPTQFGADPAHPFDISKQFYGKPKNHPDGRGAYESIAIYDGNLNGGKMGVVEFTVEQGGFIGWSAAFNVVKVQ